MIKGDIIKKEDLSKILVHASSYDFSTDKRLLIPFTEEEKIGFINQQMKVIVPPKYAMYFGDCYSKSDFIIVKVSNFLGRPDGKANPHYLWGVIDYNGNEIFPLEYEHITPSINNKSLFTLQLKDRRFAVYSSNGKVIVPFDKYDWISGFNKGFARVKIGKSVPGNLIGPNSKWGIINEEGVEIVPTTYIQIEDFYCQDIQLVKLKESKYIYKYFDIKEQKIINDKL